MVRYSRRLRYGQFTARRRIPGFTYTGIKPADFSRQRLSAMNPITQVYSDDALSITRLYFSISAYRVGRVTPSNSAALETLLLV